MVDVGVGQKDVVQFSRGDGQGAILENVLPLFHAAVHQTLTARAFQQRAASGDLVVRSQKSDFHNDPPGLGRSPCGAQYFVLYYTHICLSMQAQRGHSEIRR